MNRIALPKIPPLVSAALLLVLVVFTYLPVLSGGFIWDDDLYLTRNPLIAAPDGLARFWFSTEAMDYYPLSSTTLWLEWRLWGMDAAPYHITNVALHFTCTLLLVAVLRALRLPGAWIAGALFACHPVNVEAAAWIAQRKSLLALVFCLAALLAWLRAEGRRGPLVLLPALIFFAASLLSKTSQITLPPVLLLLAYWRQGCITRSDVIRSAPFFVLAAVAGLVTIWFQDTNAIAHHDVRPEGFLSRLAASGWTFQFYLTHAFVPHDLAIAHPRWNVDPAQLLHWLPLVASLLLAAAAWALRRHDRAATFTALATYAAFLLPVLGFLDIGFMKYSLVADHWQYGAIPALAALAAALAVRTRLGTVAALGIVLLFAFHSRERAALFADEELLWADNVEQQPESGKGWYGHASSLIHDGDLPAARAALLKSARLLPHDASVHHNLGIVHALLCDSTNALTACEQALRLEPEKHAVRLTIAHVHVMAGRHREAAAEYEHVLAALPANDTAATRLAHILATAPDEKLRNPARALQLLQPYVTNPEPHWRPLEIHADALLALGRTTEARAELTRAHARAIALHAHPETIAALHRRIAALPPPGP